MKKVIPKKKDAFAIIPIDPVEIDSSNFSCSLSPSFGVEAPIGMAGKTLHTGDLLMVRKKDGLIVPFTGSEGRSDV